MTTPEQFPLADLYEESYNVDNEIAVHGERVSEPVPLSMGVLTYPSQPPIDVGTLEDVQEGPVQKMKPKDLEVLQNPTVRDVLNNALAVVTGNVITLDSIEQHLKQTMEGVPVDQTDLAKKLSSTEGLKTLGGVGNILEAVSKEQSVRDGLPPELAGQLATTVGLAGMASPGGLARGAGKVLGKDALKRNTTILLNSLFSNPKAHVGNVTSNFLTTVWAPFERVWSATASAVRYGITGQEREVLFGEAPAMLFGLVHSQEHAIRMAGRAFHKGEDAFGPGKFSDLDKALYVGQKFDLGDVRLRVTKVNENLIDHGTKFWGRVGNAPTRGLVAEDAYAKVVNFDMERLALAYRQAIQNRKLGESTGTLFGDVQHALETMGDEARLSAQQFAIANTLNRELAELGGGAITGIGNARQWIADLSLGGIPFGRMIVPIVRTSPNQMHWVAERFPVLNFAARTVRADIVAGGRAADLAWGKLGAGSSLGVVATYYAQAGLVTGPGPVDPKLRAEWAANNERTGRQSNSVRLGDTYYGFDRFGQLGTMLSMWARYSEIAASLPPDKQDNLAAAIVLGTAQDMTDPIMLQGPAHLFGALAGDMAALRALEKDIVRVTTPGLLRDIKQSVDPVIRDTEPRGWSLHETLLHREIRHLINLYEADVPGFSGYLEPKYDLFGRPRLTPAGYGPDMLSPVKMSTLTHDAASDEIDRLGSLGIIKTGAPPQVILGTTDPDAPTLTGRTSPLAHGVELSSGEYAEYQRLAGSEFKMRGVSLHEAISKLIASDNYKNRTDQRRQEERLPGEQPGDTWRASQIDLLVTAFQSGAKAQLLKNNPGILEAFKARANNVSRALRQAPAPSLGEAPVFRTTP